MREVNNAELQHRFCCTEMLPAVIIASMLGVYHGKVTFPNDYPFKVYYQAVFSSSSYC